MIEGQCCKTCRHWKEERWFTRVASNPSPHFCALGDSDMGEPVSQTTLAYAVDYEEYRSRLITKPEFGCVQWEPAAE